MTAQGNAEDQRGQLREEAATWFARMRGPDAERHRDAFEEWLARGAVHRSAYNRIAEIFSAGKVLKEDSRRDTRRHAIMAVRPALLAAAMLIVLLTICGVAFNWSAVAPEREAKPVQLVSLIGQLRRVALADGSVVTLDSNTLLTVRFDRSARLLQLKRGRVRFDVSHDGRPFTVIAGDDRVVAHGTVFDVDLQDGGGVAVALLRGVIDVTTLEHATGRPVGQSVTLRPGQKLVSAPSQQPSAPVAIGQAPDWTDRLGLFDRAPLSDVVAAANRYSIDKIVIDEPAIAKLRVSGTFRIADAPRLCERLATLFDLVIDRQTPGIIALRRKPSDKLSRSP